MAIALGLFLCIFIMKCFPCLYKKKIIQIIFHCVLNACWFVCGFDSIENNSLYSGGKLRPGCSCRTLRITSMCITDRSLKFLKNKILVMFRKFVCNLQASARYNIYSTEEHLDSLCRMK